MAVIKLHESLLQSLIQGCIELERDSQKKFYSNFYGYALTVCHRYIHQEDDAIEVMGGATSAAKPAKCQCGCRNKAH